MSSFSSCVRVLYSTSNLDRSVNTIVHCSDGKYVEVPKSIAAKCKFIPQTDDESIPEFEYPAPVLENLVCWTAMYGMDGVAESNIARPCVYRNVLYVLKGEWDPGFLTSRLMNELNIGYYLQTINAAEKFNMKGLHDFLCVCLSCKIRNDEDTELILKFMGLPEDVEVTSEDTENASTRYPWLDKAVEPIVRK